MEMNKIQSMEKSRDYKNQEQGHTPTSKAVYRLKQEMVENGLITKEELTKAETAARSENKPLSKTLERLGIIKTAHMANFIGSKISIPYVNLEKFKVDQKVLTLIPSKIVHRYQIVPLSVVDKVLTIATSDPLDIFSIDELRQMAGCEIGIVIASSESIGMAIDQEYAAGEERQELIVDIEEPYQSSTKNEEENPNQYTNELNEIRLTKASEDASIVRMVNNYIAQAVVEGASDIHFEPQRNNMNVRFRIDGYLYERQSVSPKMIAPVVSRIKVLSGLDLLKKRLPQEGRMSFRIKNKDIFLRSSIFPSMYGENVVLRILDKTGDIPQLSEIGISKENLNVFIRLTKATKGIILATGPSGSGKATTLYSLMNSLNKSEKNIVTIEDPIEHEIEGIVQSQINPAAGITFAYALKSIMHQDPDIIYIGELRDHETAMVASRAAQTGHLVLSTMHTSSAVGAITRFRDMGVREGLVESVLSCSFAQRLVRMLCVHCRQEYIPEQRLLEDLALAVDTKFYKEKGCEACSGIGYKGRIGLFEILVVDGKIKELLSKDAPEEEITKAARANGMKTLFEDGLEKVLQGITTLDEVSKATEET